MTTFDLPDTAAVVSQGLVAIDTREIMKVGGRTGQCPSRGHLLVEGAVMVERTPLDDLLDSAVGQVRTARKPWRCTCADPVRRWEAKGWFEGGWTASTCRTEAEAAAIVADMLAGYRKATIKGARFDRAEVVPVENPNYRPDCLGDIAVGQRYFEYLGESAAWESGIRYCARCAVVWVGVQ